jgi:hypothetical protein
MGLALRKETMNISCIAFLEAMFSIFCPLVKRLSYLKGVKKT